MTATGDVTQHEQAAAFRDMHRAHARGILVLPNAWDAMSARLIEEAGARAIATTSSGVAWSLGCRDGHGATRQDVVAAVRRIVDTVRVPVTADVESGYGKGTPSDVAETVRAIIGAGAVGINLEDTPGLNGQTILAPAQQAERLAAARAAAVSEGVDLYINARIDVYLRHVGLEAERFGDTALRAKAYVDAGASGVFVPSVTDAMTIGRLVDAIDAPLNIMAGPGAPSPVALQKLGVSRVSLGPGIALAVMMQIRLSAFEVLTAGTYDSMRGGVPFGEANALFPAITASAP